MVGASYNGFPKMHDPDLCAHPERRPRSDPPAPTEDPVALETWLAK